MTIEASGSLKGRLVVVTGASGDIGTELAMAAARDGAIVVGTYMSSKSRAKGLASRAEKMGLHIEMMRLDVSDEADVKKFFSKLSEKHRKLDALINVAGHSDRRVWFSKLDELNERTWMDVLKVDLLGSFYCCREAAKMMREGGSIVNFSSAAGITGHSEGLPYTAAKSAIVGLTKSLAMVLGPKVRVNAVAPGNVEAGSIRWYDEGGRRMLAEEAALRRLGKASEVAEVAIFLASDRSSYVTGQVLLVDGGI